MKTLIIVAITVLVASLSASHASENLFGIGISVQDHVSPNKGVVIVGFAPNSPARSVGLEVGDIINKIGIHDVDTPENAAAEIDIFGLKNGVGRSVDIEIERSIAMPYQPPKYYKYSVPVAYHGGSYDYWSFQNTGWSYISAFVQDATLGNGAETLCLIDYFFHVQAQDISVDEFLRSCAPLMKKDISLLKLNSPGSFQAGQWGAAMISYRDLLRGRKSTKVLGSKALGECAEDLTEFSIREIAIAYNELEEGQYIATSLRETGEEVALASAVQCAISILQNR